MRTLSKTIIILSYLILNFGFKYPDFIYLNSKQKVVSTDFIRYEAELATKSGDAIKESTIPGFSGTGYVNQKNGNVTFNVSVSTTAKYNIKISYSTVNQRKDNDLVVNGEKLTTLQFNSGESWEILPVNKVMLSKGSNTITIQKNWGYTNFDYLEITEIAAIDTFSLSESLINPNATPEAVNVYNFLKTNFGKKVISGAMANYSTGIEEAIWMNQQTGKWPALTCFDFINYTSIVNWVDYNALVDNAIAWSKNNGLVSIMWHWKDPSKLTDQYLTEKTTFDVSKVTDTSSSEYAAMIRDIDMIAVYLKALQTAKVPVIWRPMHEASGKWFWWGAKGSTYCKNLWVLMYDRLVNYHKLNNLIWVWTSDAANDAKTWYPGDNYVDIIGMDIYPGDQHKSEYYPFDRVKEMSKGRKIIALSECASIPDVNKMFAYGDTWSWFMPWNADFTRLDKYNGANYITSLFQNINVITRDEMPNLKDLLNTDNIETEQTCNIYMVDNELFVSLTDNKKRQIYVYDMLGKLIINKSLTNTHNSFNFQFKGVFIAILTNDYEKQTYKFIVK